MPSAVQTSIQFAAKAALVDFLEPRLDCDVEWGYDGKPKAEGVYVGNIKGTQAPASIGTNYARRENFDIEMSVCVQGRGKQREITQRCYELAARVEEQLRASMDGMTLGGQVENAEITDSDLREGATPDGRIAYLDYLVAVRATLRIQ